MTRGITSHFQSHGLADQSGLYIQDTLSNQRREVIRPSWLLLFIPLSQLHMTVGITALVAQGGGGAATLCQKVITASTARTPNLNRGGQSVLRASWYFVLGFCLSTRMYEHVSANRETECFLVLHHEVDLGSRPSISRHDSIGWHFGFRHSGSLVNRSGTCVRVRSS